jgi:hypothetical protein
VQHARTRLHCSRLWPPPPAFGAADSQAPNTSPRATLKTPSGGRPTEASLRSGHAMSTRRRSQKPVSSVGRRGIQSGGRRVALRPRLTRPCPALGSRMNPRPGRAHPAPCERGNGDRASAHTVLLTGTGPRTSLQVSGFTNARSGSALRECLARSIEVLPDKEPGRWVSLVVERHGSPNSLNTVPNRVPDSAFLPRLGGPT